MQFKSFAASLLSLAVLTAAAPVSEPREADPVMVVFSEFNNPTCAIASNRMQVINPSQSGKCRPFLKKAPGVDITEIAGTCTCKSKRTSSSSLIVYIANKCAVELFSDEACEETWITRKSPMCFGNNVDTWGSAMAHC